MIALEFILGNLFIIYTVILHILSPGTFLDILTSFCNIWAGGGVVLILLSVFRMKNGCSWWSRRGKKLKIVICSVAGFCGAVALFNLILILTPRTIKMNEVLPEKTYVFLLGGGIDKNGKLPKPVMWRVKKTADYMNLNQEAVCVVTGGTLKWLPYPEAPEIKRQLVKAGISEERIFVEDQALDTIQNLQLSVELLKKEYGITTQEVQTSPVVLVSSRYHLKRAERLAKRMGFENVSGLGARTPVFYLPVSYLREICAHVKLNARILLTGKPGRIE